MERPRLGPAVWLALALCLALRLLLALLPERSLLVADSVRIRDSWRVESGLRSGAEMSPRVLVSGSSRLLSMKPKQHAKQLGLPASEVAHVSKVGNGWWDTLTLLRRNPALLEDLELLVMDVYPAQARVSERFSENDLLFLSQAELRERWRVGHLGHRLQALVDPLLPLWTRRLRVPEWLELLREVMTGDTAVPEPVPEMLRARDMWAEVSDHERVALQAEFLFPTTPRSGVELGALRDLADRLPEGSRLLLVWLPFRHDFRELVSRDEGMRSSRASFRALLEGFDHPRVEVVWFDDQKELGLLDEDYTADGAHLTPKGNAKLLGALARLERQIMRNP